MATGIASYEFQNRVRDLSAPFESLRVQQPMLISLISVGAPLRATKAEWLESSLSPIQTLLDDGTGVNDSDTTFVVDSTAGFKAGDILYVELFNGDSTDELIRVSSVDSATQFTVVRGYGSTTAAAITDNSKLILHSRPKNENTNADASDNSEPSTNYNYTEIFDETATVSRTSQQVLMYGVENLLNEKVAEKSLAVLRRMNNALIRGARVERSASNNGTTGGFLRYLAGGNVIPVSAAISAAKINDGLEDIFEDGGYSNNYAIVCAPNQARKISAFNTAGTNPQIMIPSAGQAYGGAISEFRGDIPAMQGFTAKIVVEPNMPKDQVAILDMNRISARYLQTLTDVDATQNGQDGFSRRLLCEVAYEIKDGQKAHALLTGLDV